MSFMHPATAKGTPLTAVELEILQLLASGHTVKSIAASLGRSEASINERLRDARRKTGASSSRELARRLDAQKIWDKNFDLGEGPAADDLSTSPPARREGRSKGTVMMLICIPIAAAALAAMAGVTDRSTPAPAAEAATTQSSPLLGTWALGTDRIPAGERPRSVTLSFATSSSGEWQGKVEIVGPDGSVQNAVSSATPDGPPVPLSGNMKFADTVTMRRPAPGTLVMTFEKDGKPVSTRVYTVEGDGNAMKETIIWAGDAEPRMVTTYFHRVG